MKRTKSSPQLSPTPRRTPSRRATGAVRRSDVAAIVAELVEQRLAPAEPPAVEAPAAEPSEPVERPKSLFIDRPVRSGQCIRFPEGDVTVIGSVSSGAEIVAGGSIHVYGALRGRAFAGFGGNPAARILCSCLDAELIAIDGLYATADEIAPALRNKPAQVRVDGQAMSVTALD